jgi:hypothetical protein
MREQARPSPGGALSPIQIERETRISNHIAPETGWRSLAPIQELLDFPE